VDQRSVVLTGLHVDEEERHHQVEAGSAEADPVDRGVAHQHLTVAAAVRLVTHRVEERHLKRAHTHTHTHTHTQYFILPEHNNRNPSWSFCVCFNFNFNFKFLLSHPLLYKYNRFVKFLCAKHPTAVAD